MNTLQDVLNAWQNNQEFRENFKVNPEQALIDADLQLNAADLEKLKSMLNQHPNPLSDDKLDDRISK